MVLAMEIVASTTMQTGAVARQSPRHYRIYLCGSTGAIITGQDAFAVTDEEAVDLARTVVPATFAGEVWQAARLVARVEGSR
jgi:hypothetical protein